LLYWTAASWGEAISLSKDNPDLIADQPIVEALIDRAYKLDPDFGTGAIDGFLITYEPSRQGAKGDPLARSREHFARAVALSHGQLAGPYVSWLRQYQSRSKIGPSSSRCSAGRWPSIPTPDPSGDSRTC